MTAQVQTRRSKNDQQDAPKRRNKATAFALAGLVATAGIAGVVVTSSAYFTDVKDIGANTVTLRGVDIEAYADNSSGASIITAPLNLTELAPLASATTAEFDTAPTYSFEVRNISTSKFKYKVEVTDIVLKRKDGTSSLPNPAVGAPTESEIANVIKINMVRAASGTPAAYSAGAGVNLTTLRATPTILAETGTLSTLEKESTSLTTDQGTIGFRIWIEQSEIATWPADKQNWLQDVKVSYKLKLTATQITA